MNLHAPWNSDCCRHCKHSCPEIKSAKDIFKYMPKVFFITDACNNECRLCPWWRRTKQKIDWELTDKNVDYDEWMSQWYDSFNAESLEIAGID